MSLDPSLQARIESLIEADRVVLFMKGDRRQPRCGFSATTVSMLDSLMSDYTTFNVLDDQGIREGLKQFSEWPTIPQLYIDREFVGGCDIIKQMFNSGELHEALGLKAPDRSPPDISISDAAADLIRRAREGNPGQAVHLSIDGRWQHAFDLAPAQGHEIRAEDKGVEILFDIASAPRAKKLSIDIEETMQGTAFKIDNPNAPPPVGQISPAELAAALEARGSELTLVDTRTVEERAKAKIEPSLLLDQEAMQSLLALPKDSYMVFYCHTGVRSQSVAEHFRGEGFVDVHNLSGGIDAWSREVDSSLPRY